MRAKGSFAITITPQPNPDPEMERSDGVALGLASLQKQFQGDLQASSVGRMLSARTQQAGSAGYVAIERVTGSLAGKQGSFVLQHDGLMDRGASSLSVRVVPDSGTGELTGLRGSMRIDVTDGQHLYEFDFEL